VYDSSKETEGYTIKTSKQGAAIMDWLEMFQTKRVNLLEEKLHYREWEQYEPDPLLRRYYRDMARYVHTDLEAIEDALKCWYDMREHGKPAEDIRLGVVEQLRQVPSYAHCTLADFLDRDVPQEYLQVTTSLSQNRQIRLFT
jgi:hypothetical protein